MVRGITDSSRFTLGERGEKNNKGPNNSSTGIVKYLFIPWSDCAAIQGNFSRVKSMYFLRLTMNPEF